MLTVYYTEIPENKTVDGEKIIAKLSLSRASYVLSVANPERRISSALASLLFEKKAAAATGLSISDFSYIYGENGKPSLFCPKDLSFNLSHSGSTVCAAIMCPSGNGAAPLCGTDCEEIPDPGIKLESFLKIAKKYFGGEELGHIFGKVSDYDKTVAFLEIWTAREAHAKLTGRGIFGEIGEKDTVTFDHGKIAGFRDGTLLFIHHTDKAVISAAAEKLYNGPGVFSEVPFALLTDEKT